VWCVCVWSFELIQVVKFAEGVVSWGRGSTLFQIFEDCRESIVVGEPAVRAVKALQIGSRGVI